MNKLKHGRYALFSDFTEDCSQKGVFSGGSEELFKSYKEEKKKSYKESPMGRTESDTTEVTYLTLQYIKSFGVKKKSENIKELLHMIKMIHLTNFHAF